MYTQLFSLSYSLFLFHFSFFFFCCWCALGGHVCRASPLPPLHSLRRVTTGNSPIDAALPETSVVVQHHSSCAVVLSPRSRRRVVVVVVVVAADITAAAVTWTPVTHVLSIHSTYHNIRLCTFPFFSISLCLSLYIYLSIHPSLVIPSLHKYLLIF